MSFSLVKNLYFYLVTPTFVLRTLMCLKSIGSPFTMENLQWKKRDILLGPCLDNMTLSSKHTLKVDETRLPIFYSYVFKIKVTFLNYMCGFGRQNWQGNLYTF